MENVRARGVREKDLSNEQEWMRRAKTPETRASIRHWNRWTNSFFWVGVLLVLGGFAFIVWSVATDRHCGPVFWGVIVGTVVLILVCVVRGSHAGSRLIEARFADGRESVGTIVWVTTNHSVDGPETCDILVTASVSGAVIHRKIDGLIAGRVGDRIRFRHNTIDSEDMDDILFVGWKEHAPHRSVPDWRARQSRDLYADAQVSVGRIVEVTSHPGSPGGNDPTDYTLTVSVELSGSVTIHRQVHLAEHQLRSSGPAFRPLIRLRHNTRDPENLFDAFFDGWADEARNE